MKDYLDQIKLFLSDRSIAETMSAIANAGLFDARWYTSQAPKAVRSEMDPLRHYVVFGAAEGLDPHPLFDARWYLSQCGRNAQARANPVLHYLRRGAGQNRDPHPLFDAAWYRRQKPNLAIAGGNPLVHFVNYALSEPHDPNPLFDTRWYLARNPDVAAAKLNPLVHYLISGAREGRDPHPLFDTEWYLHHNPEVAAAGLNPLTHYLTCGISALDGPNPLFDTAWYLAQNPDVALAHQSPLVHYITTGASEGRDPNPLFDTDWYVKQNPDVALAGTNPLAHYMDAGVSEARDPNPLFDTDWYLERNPEVARARINPLAHYLAGAYGWCEPNWWFDTHSYVAMNPDAGAACVNPLVHYLAANSRPQRRRDAAFDAARRALPGLAAAEPTLAPIAGQLSNLKYITGHARGLGFARWRDLLRSFSQVYDRMIFMPLIEGGPADLPGMNALRAAHQQQRGPALARVTRLYGYSCQLRGPGACSQHEQDWLSHLSRIYFDNAVLMSLFVRDYDALRERFVLLPQPPSFRENIMAGRYSEAVPGPGQTPSETERRSLHVGFDSAYPPSWDSYFKLFAESPSFLD